jgi:hypothetical protein
MFPIGLVLGVTYETFAVLVSLGVCGGFGRLAYVVLLLCYSHDCYAWHRVVKEYKEKAVTVLSCAAGR